VSASSDTGSEFSSSTTISPVRSLLPIAVVSMVICTFSGAAFGWQLQSTGVDANLRGVSITQMRTGGYAMWVSGTKGAVLRSVDDGKSWRKLKVDGAADLDFRDIEAFGDQVAYLMSSGDGDKSRIYKTTNGGETWSLQFTSRRTGFFLDSLACESLNRCFALSDPVDGKFLILSTEDGQHWLELPRDKMPTALPSEGAFAASGTSIALCGGQIFFGTGGPAARVFRSVDRGLSWTATETPMAMGNSSSGIFSIACHGNSVVAVGGDYREPTGATKVAIYSQDSGATWRLAERQPGGYRSAVVFLSDGNLLAVGPSGSDLSRDSGVHWAFADSLNLNAVSVVGDASCSVGPKGMASCLVRHKP
jgi:photosystem II stability/assembly factor-like uncharacterized protein